MNPEQQRVAIAEACGWTAREDIENFWRAVDASGNMTHELWMSESNVWAAGIPNYLNDLNAMQSSVQSQSERFQDDFDNALKNSGKWVASMTAQEWADIFILCLQSQRDSGNSTP